jgi:hypothetical protein
MAKTGKFYNSKDKKIKGVKPITGKYQTKTAKSLERNKNDKVP